MSPGKKHEKNIKKAIKNPLIFMGHENPQVLGKHHENVGSLFMAF